MDLTSEHPFWSLKDGLVASFPPISDDLQCEVVVLGAGVTGALLAQRLSSIGLSVVVVDRRDACCGSTSASTALLQYEIDISLLKMASILGREKAERAYTLSHQSIDDLEQLVARINGNCEFHRKTSIYLADSRKSAKLLADEARARQALGLDVTYHDASNVRDAFGVEGVAALSSKQAASCDPYLLAHQLLADAIRNGAQVFDRTEVTKIDCLGDRVVLRTNRDAVICARTVVMATGYESQSMLKEKVVNLDNTYALVSQPHLDLGQWNKDWMLWEAKQPYLYLRITEDGRLLVGGEDDAYHSPVKRDASLAAKAKRIEAKTRDLLPDLGWECEFAWAGTFGKTRDGLAYIGATDEYPRCLFALGFGGNGITFSAIAANIIANQLMGNEDENADLFRFGR